MVRYPAAATQIATKPPISDTNRNQTLAMVIPCFPAPITTSGMVRVGLIHGLQPRFGQKGHKENDSGANSVFISEWTCTKRGLKNLRISDMDGLQPMGIAYTCFPSYYTTSRTIPMGLDVIFVLDYVPGPDNFLRLIKIVPSPPG